MIKFQKQVTKGCINMTPVKINYKYNQKKAFGSYPGGRKGQWRLQVTLCNFFSLWFSQIFYNNHILPL